MIKKLYDTQIDGSLTIANYIMPLSDGTVGQALVTDGSGSVGFATIAGGSGAFTSDGTIITESAAEYDVNFVIGSPQLDDDGDVAHDSRMFFDKGKGALRGGTVTGTEWDAANVGVGSTAFGRHSTASGQDSFASGQNTEAIGLGDTAMGTNTVASGTSSFAVGNGPTASGLAAVAMGGSNATASGDYSFAMGSNALPSGRYSMAVGSVAIASDDYATAIGSGVTASGYASLALGSSSTAGGSRAIVMGGDSQADADYSMASGLGANATMYGAFTRATTSNADEKQYSLVTGEANTADATPTEIFLDDADTERMVLSEDLLSYAYTIRVMCHRVEHAFYEIQGMIFRDISSNVALIGTPSKSVIYESDVALDVTVTADNTNKSLKVEVTGLAGTPLEWFMKAELLEIRH